MSGRASRPSSGRGVMLSALVLFAACGGPTVPPKPEMARLTVSASVAGTAVATMVVRVSATDINPPLVFNLDIVNGQATGLVIVPAGSNRRLQLEAYDANHIRTHEGEKTIPVVNPGTANDAVTITLNPVPGQQPITVTFGRFLVAVSGSTTLSAGGTTQLAATVRDAEGRTLTVPPSEIRWATDNPTVATVDGNGLVTGVAAGTTIIMATYRGAGGAVTVTVN